MVEKFIMLPNNLVWNYKNAKDTYLNKYGEKICYIFCYLDGMTNRFGNTIFTIKDMVTNAGLTPKSGIGRVNNQFKNILVGLQKKSIIETDTDLVNVNSTSIVHCIFNMPIKKDANGNNIEFFPITHNDYFTIMNRYDGNLNKLTLLMIYCYINARIYKREISLSDYIPSLGGKAECFYDDYSTITKDLCISEETWFGYIQELNRLGLLFYDSIGLVSFNGNTHNANNVYCTNPYELEEALKQSKFYYENEGYKIIGKKTSSEIKVLNGLRGKIRQETNQNKETSKLNSKLQNLTNGLSNATNIDKLNKLQDFVETSINGNNELLEKFYNEFKDVKFYELESKKMDNVIMDVYLFFRKHNNIEGVS